MKSAINESKNTSSNLVASSSKDQVSPVHKRFSLANFRKALGLTYCKSNQSHIIRVKQPELLRLRSEECEIERANIIYKANVARRWKQMMSDYRNYIKTNLTIKTGACNN